MDLWCSPPMKACDPASPFYGLPPLYPPPPPPPLAGINIGDNVGSFSKTMSNFACNHSFDYGDYPYAFSLPEDLYQEGNPMPEFDVSPTVDLLGESYKDSYLLQDYWNKYHGMDFNGFHSEAFQDPHFPIMAYQWPPNLLGHTDSEDNYDRISQLWSRRLPNDFDGGCYVEGKSIGKGFHSQDNLVEDKKFGLYSERSMNSNMMENDTARIAEENALKTLFEDFAERVNVRVDDLAPSFHRSESHKQPVQKSSMAAEAEENYRSCWKYGEQLKTEMQQAISSLMAHVSRLEIQVDHLTHQVQDMADKIFAENKLNSTISDQIDDTKAVLEESEEISSSADEIVENKLFIQTEDSSQKIDDDSSFFEDDWEII